MLIKLVKWYRKTRKGYFDLENPKIVTATIFLQRLKRLLFF